MAVSSIKTKLKRKISNYLLSYFSELRLQSGQAAILASRGLSRSFRDLWDAEVRVYSQWGEDGILDYLFESLRISKPRMLELGAGNFNECNSRFAAEFRNASVYAVDAREDLITNMQALSLSWKNTVYAFKDWITPSTAKFHLNQAFNLLGGVDVISLDIDGNDYWICKDLELSNISILVVEYNPLFGSLNRITVPRKDNFNRTVAHYSNLYFGASLAAWIDLFEQKGFVFVGSNRVGNNAFFIPKNRAGEISIPLPAWEKRTDFTDWRVRESRDENGKFSYLSVADALELISDLPLIDVSTGNVTSLNILKC
jgi:hypothetical protein